MTPCWVVKHLDVVEDVGLGLLPCGIDLPAHPLAFEQLEEALRHGVVVAVATPAHAAQQVVLAQKALPGVAGELTPLIRVNQQLLVRAVAPQRHQ